MFATVTTQSVVLALGGVLLVGFVIAERRSLLDGLKRTVGLDTGHLDQQATKDGSGPEQQPEEAPDQESDTQVSGE